MHVYRFRLLLEDVDDFYRDIEIMANSTFEDLHKAILQAVGFDGKELASFYISNSTWNRMKEITLVDMSEEDDKENAPLLMGKCKLFEFIDDPHQRLIYVYDFLNMYEFYIELYKIVQSEKGIKYPRCVKQSGLLPKAGSFIHSRSFSIFDDEEILVEYEAGLQEDDAANSLSLFSDKDVTSGFAEELSNSFEDD